MSRRKKPSPPPVAYSATNPQPSPDDKEPIRDMTEMPRPGEHVRTWGADGRMIGADFIDGRFWAPFNGGWIEPVKWQRVRDTSHFKGGGWSSDSSDRVP